MNISFKSWMNDSKKALMTFTSPCLIILLELAGINRIKIGSNNKTFSMFKISTSSVQQGHCKPCHVSKCSFIMLDCHDIRCGSNTYLL